jgi:endothelin-converting enzyme/putative endopeptidase
MSYSNSKRKATLGLAAFLILASGGARAADPDTASAPAKTLGFDAAALDKTVAPCDDFYQFACGGWTKANPIPGDQSSWGRFNELAERNRVTLREILDEAAKGGASQAPFDRKLGDFYGSCMDEAKVEALGASALKPQLDGIAALKSKAELPAALAGLHRAGVEAVFAFGAEQDFKDTTQVIAQADQGGLGLPERDYYFKDDAKSVEIRKQYVDHVAKMFTLLGDKPEAASAHARTVMGIESTLAKASLTAVQRRDPQLLYHKMTVAELQKLSPSFDWNAYVVATGAPRVESLNVVVPEFVKALEQQLESVSLADWQSYLRWHAARAAAPFLSTPFVNAGFEFYGRTLRGQKQLQPRWKRCVEYADNALGEAVGQKFVEKTFGADGKERMNAMVTALEQALDADIKGLPWMTDATKTQALGKLDAIRRKIGYPDKWRDYSSYQVAPGDFAGNVRRANAFETKRQLDKIGKPVDRGEWGMTPPTVNAYYNPLMNDINFPAGILQPPFFERGMDDAVNFGAIGSVIGHEMTHGFDDEGRQFAADGTLNDWWSEADAKAFEERAQCIAEQYSGFTAVDDVKLNGKLTLGENTADNGGVRIAYMALLQTLANAQQQPRDGFTPEQRFFLAWGQIWCTNRTPEAERLRAQTDPHSPGRYRVNGVVSSMPEFQQAFACPAGAAMVRERPCRVW